MTAATLVRRLRAHALPDPHDEREVMHAPLLREAADEIERLTAPKDVHSAGSESLRLRIDPARPGIAMIEGGDECAGLLLGMRASRIVECVNACEGYGNPAALIRDAVIAYAHGEKLRTEGDDLRASNAELRLALQAWSEWQKDEHPDELKLDRAQELTEAVLAKVQP